MAQHKWLPELLCLSSFGGNWNDYVEAVYGVFEDDFIRSVTLLKNVRVGVRRDPSFGGKWFTFWHCVSEGEVEEQRTPCMRRCERIPWIRPMAANHHDVETWQAKKKGDDRGYLWIDEEYLVVLGIRSSHYLLITAFPTPLEHTKKKLRNEKQQSQPL